MASGRGEFHGENRALGLHESPEMIELTTLTKPGPFGPRTHELGTYIGIRDGARLAAMAGERLKVPGFTEISAVCTHPDFLGKGFAGVLDVRGDARRPRSRRDAIPSCAGRQHEGNCALRKAGIQDETQGPLCGVAPKSKKDKLKFQ